MSQTVQKKYDFDRVVRMVLTVISVGIGVWLVKSSLAASEDRKSNGEFKYND